VNKIQSEKEDEMCMCVCPCEEHIKIIRESIIINSSITRG